MTTLTSQRFTDLAAQARDIADKAEAAAAELAARERFTAGFRSGTKNHTAARYLLDQAGAWVTKADVVDWTGILPTAIPRVVAVLRRNGCTVETKRDQRRISYRVTLPQ